MRIYRLVSTAIGGVFMASLSTAAIAGCGGNTVCNSQVIAYEGVQNTSCYSPTPAPTCAPRVTVHSNYVGQQPNVGVYNSAPYGYLRNFEYKNGQNINITRVHSRTPYVSLSDAPSSFTGGCTPTSTNYCRSGSRQGTPVNVVFNQPPAPVFAAPVSRHMSSHVTYGSGYNAANFAPRQYGSTAFVPGIAHVPTSIVDRSPITHINGYPQPQVQSVTTASSSTNSYGYRSNTSHRSTSSAHGGNVIGSVVAHQYTYQPSGGGAYWEKASGPTMVGGLPATQILCRRAAPRPAPITVRVVRPVIGVPTGCAPVRNSCAPVCQPRKPVCAPVCAPVKPVCAPKCAPVRPTCAPVGCGAVSSRYGSRWTQ